MASRWVFSAFIIVEKDDNNPATPEQLKKYCQEHKIEYSQPADKNSPAVFEIKL